MTTCTVTRNGNSATVVLPADWRRANGVDVGDELEVSTDVRGAITFRKPESDDRLAAFEEMLAFANTLPVIEWEDGTDPEDDKRVLRERYA